MKKLTKSTARIFIVEDEPMYLAMLKKALSNAGYTNTAMFSSGEAMVDELYTMPDIVVLDHNLDGDLSGLDVLKKIKSVNPDIHVIFISAQEKMNIALQALKFGAFDYVIKNVGALDNVVKQLDKVLQMDARSKRPLSGLPWFRFALPAAVAAGSIITLALS